MEFKIQDLAVMASDIQYNPALAVAVNKALNFRGSQVEYDVLMKEATQIAIGYNNIELAEMKDYGMGSVFGLPLWQPLTFLGEPGQDDLLLENAVLELNRTKNIVTTVVQGRDTSVDEFINNGDWQINVSGILATKKPEYPMDLVLQYQDYMNRNASIEVTHELLNKLGIHEIVILSESLPKTPHWNIQTYSFTAKATKPLPLIIDLKATAPKY